MIKRWADMEEIERRKHNTYVYFNRNRIRDRCMMKTESLQIESEAEYTLMFLDVCNRYVTPEKLA